MEHELIRLIRIRSDLKANELAKKLGISSSFLSELERGKKNISINLLKRYSEIFNFNLSSFFLCIEFSKKENDFKSIDKIKLMKFMPKFLGI
jgi:transcriptional regulator with XRE-family HTH domain